MCAIFAYGFLLLIKLRRRRRTCGVLKTKQNNTLSIYLVYSYWKEAHVILFLDRTYNSPLQSFSSQLIEWFDCVVCCCVVPNIVVFFSNSQLLLCVVAMASRVLYIFCATLILSHIHSQNMPGFAMCIWLWAVLCCLRRDWRRLNTPPYHHQTISCAIPK